MFLQVCKLNVFELSSCGYFSEQILIFASKLIFIKMLNSLIALIYVLFFPVLRYEKHVHYTPARLNMTLSCPLSQGPYSTMVSLHF